MPHLSNGTLKVQIDSTVDVDWKDPKLVKMPYYLSLIISIDPRSS